MNMFRSPNDCGSNSEAHPTYTEYFSTQRYEPEKAMADFVESVVRKLADPITDITARSFLP